MLKFIFAFLFSFSALACSGFQVEGKLSVDGQDWKFSRKFNLGKEEIIPVGPYLLAMTFTFPDSGYLARYRVQEKKGVNLILITKGEEAEIPMNSSRDIMARGETNQPHSIISIKLNEH